MSNLSDEQRREDARQDARRLDSDQVLVAVLEERLENFRREFSREFERVHRDIEELKQKEEKAHGQIRELVAAQKASDRTMGTFLEEYGTYKGAVIEHGLWLDPRKKQLDDMLSSHGERIAATKVRGQWAAFGRSVLDIVPKATTIGAVIYGGWKLLLRLE